MSVNTPVPLALRPEPGEAYARLESPKGELGFYLVSDGGPAPYRWHVRSPSLINLMKQAGYRTYWITNQQTMTKRNTMLTTFSEQADEQLPDDLAVDDRGVGVDAPRVRRVLRVIGDVDTLAGLGLHEAIRVERVRETQPAVIRALREHLVRGQD